MSCEMSIIPTRLLVHFKFNFITQDYQLLTYKRAEIICTEYELNIDFKIKLEKWTYCLFLNDYYN